MTFLYFYKIALSSLLQAV